MNKKIFLTKNIFCIITVVWSALMLTQYSLILLPIQSNNILLEILLNYLIPALFLGIWIVPVLYLLSLIFITVSKAKCEHIEDRNILNIATVILPIVLYILMLSTDFLVRLG